MPSRASPSSAQSLFSAFSPSAAKGCPGRLAGSGGRVDKAQHPHTVSKILRQGHEGRSRQLTSTGNSGFRSLPYFKMVTSGAPMCVACALRTNLQTQDKQKGKLRFTAISLGVCKMGMRGLLQELCDKTIQRDRLGETQTPAHRQSPHTGSRGHGVQLGSGGLGPAGGKCLTHHPKSDPRKP
jgi:hypothetical protein